MNLDINKFMKILSGDTLLEKVKELEGAPLSRVLTECGYTFRGKNNCEQFNYLYFYEQVFRATGIINKDTTLISIDDLSKVVSSKEFVEKTPKVWDKAKEPEYNFSGFFEEIVGGKEKNNDLEIWREQNLYPFFEIILVKYDLPVAICPVTKYTFMFSMSCYIYNCIIRL